MGARENLQKLIDRKHQEIQELETALTHARIYLQALQDSVKALPKEPPSSYSGTFGPEPTPKLREGSMLWAARECLLAARRPLHINDLLISMGRQAEEKEKLSLTGSIGWYVRKGKIFTRPAPNTFGLVELVSAGATPKGHAETKEAVSLPETFGE